MKNLVITTVVVGTLIAGGITFAGGKYSKKGNEFICFSQISLKHKDHDDGKCDICNKQDLFGMVKGNGCAEYEWCSKCTDEILSKAKSM